MFLASGLSVGGGDCRGRAGRRQAGPRFILGIWDPAGSGPMGEGTWIPGLGRSANASCLADSPGSPTCSCYLCAPAPKAQPVSFRVYFSLSGSAPYSVSKCPQDSWALLSGAPFPEPCPGCGGRRRSPCTTHQRRGSAGWATGSLSGLWAAARPSQSSWGRPGRQGSV